MNKVTIDRELLEQVASEFEHDNDRYMLGRELRKVLDAPLQPEGEKIAWSLRSDVAGCGLVRYMTDSKYQAQTQAIKQWYEPFRCQQCTDAQRAIAELLDRLDVMTQCADNYSRMFEESAEELDAAREILAQQGRRNTELRAERDTLRQQLAELRDMLSGEVEANIPLRQKAFDLTEQRDKLAEILRDIVPGCKWKHMRPRIDAALVEIDHDNE